MGDALGAAPWFEVFQGLNVIVNGFFIGTDINKFKKLMKLRKTWIEGDEQARKKMMEEEEYFEKENSMRKFISEIREKVVRQDY